MTESMTSIGVDLSETVLDAMLDDGLLKDVPVIGTMVNLARLTREVRDRILLSKLRAFLSASSSLTEDQRREFVSQMNSDPATASRVHDQLVIYLDRFDTISKADVLGILFTALAQGRIPAEVFHRLSHRLDTCFADDLPRLDEFLDHSDGLVCHPPYPLLPGLIDPVDNMGGPDGIQLYQITLEGSVLSKLIRHHREKNTKTDDKKA